MPNAIAYLLTFFLTFGATTLFISEMFPDFEKLRVRAKMGVGPMMTKETPALFRIVRPLLVLVAPFIAGLELPGMRKRVERRLKAGGFFGVLPVDDFIAAKFVFAGLLAGLALLYIEVLPVGVIVLAGIAGFFVPNLWIRDRINFRRKAITKDLPFFLDLLTLSVEAGLDFSAAIGKVVEKARPSALREEFQIMLHETQLGASRSEALHNLSERIQTAEIASLTATLIQAAQIGASIGVSLRAQSEIVRSSRFTTAEKKGAEASQKMLIPMILFVMPSVLLVITAPIIISYIYRPTP
ncbi:MAG: type II secretion system F family protein [Acidobacteriota bacterium]